MSHTYGPHRRRYHHPPRWFTNLVVVRPERRWTKKTLKELTLGFTVDLEDAPEFPK